MWGGASLVSGPIPNIEKPGMELVTRPLAKPSTLYYTKYVTQTNAVPEISTTVTNCSDTHLAWINSRSS